jgi:NADH-quinone oxidoreductase subunit L
VVFDYHVLEKGAVFNQNLYTWMQIGGLNISVGFLVDNLTAVMLVVPTEEQLHKIVTHHQHKH